MSILQKIIFSRKTQFAVATTFLMTPCLMAQNGDKKEKNKDLLNSTNWRKWAPNPVPFLEPEQTSTGFKIAPGFKIELVASYPMIKDPVAAEFDLKGRLWVCEFQTYMMDADGKNHNKAISRVQVLEDTNGDGKMDKATTFLDKVTNPRSVSIVKGGALVALSDGTLIFAEDTDGDLIADKRTKLMDFATAAPQNIEHAENGLHFALDNWMYNSSSKRRLTWRKGKIKEEPAPKRGQWGMSSDAYGRLYYNSNSMWYGTDSSIYHGQLGKPRANTRLVRGIRTNTAINRAYKPGTIKPDGRIDQVTSVSGLTVHSDGAFGEAWNGTIFSCSPGTNTVGAFKPNSPMPNTTKHDHQLYKDPKWQQREFLSSTDERFRPVNATTGPDGAIYLVDMNRGIIQDKLFLTSYLRRQSEERKLDKHIGKGRIWRIVPEKHTPVAAPTDLISGLSHPYLWWRLNSQKRIVEEQLLEHAPELIKLATSKASSAKTKAHAMWTLSGLGKLTTSVIDTNLVDADWFVSLTALRLAGEATGNPTTFPEANKEAATALSKHKVKAVASYSKLLTSKGYPNSGTPVYKDKMPKWIKADKKLSHSYNSGLKVYSMFCGQCHQANGKGLTGTAPLLAKSNWVTDHPNIIMGVALHGLSGPIKINGKPVKNVPQIMAAHSFLNDQQMADTLTYVRNAWGNKASPINVEQVKQFRAKHGKRAPWTEEEIQTLKPKSK